MTILRPIIFAILAVLAVGLRTEVYSQVPTQTVILNLAWQDNSQNETGFRVFQCVGTGCQNFTKIGADQPANTVKYTDTIKNDPGNRVICYRVTAFNTAGESPPSNISCATTPAIVPVEVPPGAPTGTVATIVTVTVGP